MTENGELTRDDLVIDPDMEIDEDDSTITAYVETWFDVDRKFKTHTAEDADTWVNFYAKFHPESGELTTGYQIDRPDGSDWKEYHPTEKEKQLLIDMMEECFQKHHGCSLLEYVQENDDITMNGGIL